MRQKGNVRTNTICREAAELPTCGEIFLQLLTKELLHILVPARQLFLVLDRFLFKIPGVTKQIVHLGGDVLLEPLMVCLLCAVQVSHFSGASILAVLKIGK